MPKFLLAAVDPMAMILSNKAYIIWVELKHPHEPSIGAIQAALKTMTPQERRSTIARAKELAAYGKAFEEAAAAK